MKIEINIQRRHLAYLVFTAAILVAINYSIAQTSTPNPGHSPSEIGPGTFAGGGDYVFPSGSNIKMSGRVVPSGFSVTNGVVHTAVRAAKLHYLADRDCASFGAHLCRISQWAAIDDVKSKLNRDEQVWVDGLDPYVCTEKSTTAGYRMIGWSTDDEYMVKGTYACAGAKKNKLRYRCCFS